MIVNHTFETFKNTDSKILILGSFPSVKSREANFYYMNKQNRFWEILSIIYQDDFLNPSIDAKKALLKKYGIALSDVIDECDIIGSSDSSIKDVKPMDIQNIINNTNITKIYCNGKLSYKLFLKYNPEYSNIVTYLPSTSPANAKMRISDLLIYWNNINLI